MRSTEETIISKVWFGHTGLISTLFKWGKNNTGRWDSCDQEESINQVLVNCPKYVEKRELTRNCKAVRIDLDLQELL